MRSDVSGKREQVALGNRAGQKAGLRVVDHIGGISTLEADVALGLEVFGAFPDDLDAGAVDQRLVGADEVSDRVIVLAVNDR